MGHCGGGQGASNIGNQGPSSWTTDPSGNVLMAIVKWVEEGIAPEYVEGAKFKNSTVGLSSGIDYTRQHCKYPLRNFYSDGKWECVE